MSYRIMTDQDEYSGFQYETMEDAETKLKECPKGWWIDQWYYFYVEAAKLKKLIYDTTDINEKY